MAPVSGYAALTSATDPFVAFHRHAPRHSTTNDLKSASPATVSAPPPWNHPHPRRSGPLATPAAAAFFAALLLAISSTWLVSPVLNPSWLEAGASFWFSSRPGPRREKVVVNRPALRIHSLHSCWAHAVLDSLPPVFAAAETLRGSEWTLVFGSDMLELAVDMEMLTNGTDGEPVRYKGAWGEMLEALNATDMVFEHLVEPVFNRTVVDVHYEVRMSVWDSNETYPGRPPRNRTDPGVPFRVRVKPYRTMVRRVLEHSRLPVNGDGPERRKEGQQRQRVLLIDREGGDRKFMPHVLSGLVAALEEGSNATDPNSTANFDGVQQFVNLRLREQLELVRSADVMVLRHGSAEAWGAFLRPGSVLFEVNSWSEMQDGGRPRMYDQVCHISGCRHVNVEEDAAVRELCDLLNMNGTVCKEASMTDRWEDPNYEEMWDETMDMSMMDMTDEALPMR